MPEIEKMNRVATTARKGQGFIETYRHPVKGVLTALISVVLFLLLLVLITTVIWLIAR